MTGGDAIHEWHMPARNTLKGMLFVNGVPFVVGLEQMLLLVQPQVLGKISLFGIREVSKESKWLVVWCLTDSPTSTSHQRHQRMVVSKMAFNSANYIIFGPSPLPTHLILPSHHVIIRISIPIHQPSKSYTPHEGKS